ncbi:MAG: helix-turn-helix transcriptional regulator [Myxococcaceae bacterium]
MKTPSDLKGSIFRIGRREFAMLWWGPGELSLPSELSAAEAEVVRGALAGLSNLQIAAQRGTATRTVANQLASVFRKMGVQSRHELHAVARGRRGAS